MAHKLSIRCGLVGGLLAFTFTTATIGPSATVTNTVSVVTTNKNPSGLQIVTLRPDADLDGLMEEFGLNPQFVYRLALKGFAAALNPDQMAALRRDDRVLAVEQDGRIYPASQTVGSGIIRMGITNFPVAHIDGTDHRIGVDVAVMDTGIQTNHPDLNVVHAAGFVDIPPGSPGYNGDDWKGHGTHVAGIVGALDNDFGVVGVAPGVRLWSVQVMGPVQSSWANFLAGMDYIAAHADEIEVVNASLEGFGGSYVAVHTAVSNIVAMGIVFVAGAGNNTNDISGDDFIYGTEDDFLPAALPEVMTVSGMVSDPTNSYYDTIWGTSNFGSLPKVPSYVISPGMGIDVAAPSQDILSTFINSGYRTDSGTSMASPHVAGLVALYIASNGRAHSFQDVIHIRQAIVDGSQQQSQWNPDQAAIYARPAIPTIAWSRWPTRRRPG